MKGVVRVTAPASVPPGRSIALGFTAGPTPNPSRSGVSFGFALREGGRVEAQVLDGQGRVIALGSPRQLIASLGADHVVEFALADGVQTSALLPELQGLAGVRSVRTGTDRVSLTVREVHRTLPALLALVERRGAELSLLVTHHATLDDVFLALTGRQLRDA